LTELADEALAQIAILEVQEAAEPAECDPTKENLTDFEAWRREEGYWVGEYTLLGADGDWFESGGWPYRYDHYRGFIQLELDGPNLTQNNLFLYPPQLAEDCTGEFDEETSLPTDVLGGGACGINGNEKVLAEAIQSATDCQGGLSGTFDFGA